MKLNFFYWIGNTMLWQLSLGKKDILRISDNNYFYYCKGNAKMVAVPEKDDIVYVSQKEKLICKAIIHSFDEIVLLEIIEYCDGTESIKGRQRHWTKIKN